MGIDTGADKRYRITKDNELIFEGFYDEIEGVSLKYPNGEFYELAKTLKDCNEDIDLGRFLIWDNIDYTNPDYTHTIQQLKEFSFEKAILEGNKARIYIEKNGQLVKGNYIYNYSPLDVVDYLIELWVKGYYVNWDF